MRITTTLGIAAALGAVSVPALADDFPADPSTTGRLTVGSVTGGAIELNGDTDWFAVELEAGAGYRIDVEGVPTGRGSLSDPYLFVFDANGVEINRNDDGGEGLNSRLLLRVDQTGTYYIGASAYGSATGTYSLSVQAQDLPEDDHPADATTTGTASIGQMVTGAIELEFDEDWYAVEMVGGQGYRIHLEGQPSGRGTLPDPYLYLYDADGNQLSFNDDNGENFNSRLTFVPQETGTYYVGAAAFGGATGTYTLLIEEFTAPPDDFADNTGTVGRVDVGGSITGEIEIERDRDWFAVSLTEGVTYIITQEGQPTSMGTLSDPYLTIYDDVGGELDWNDDGGTGFNARLSFVAPYTGTFYVAAGAFSVNTGTYTLAVEEFVPPEGDVGAEPENAGAIGINDELTAIIDYPGDQDLYAVELEAGVDYVISMRGLPTNDGDLADPYLYLFDADMVTIDVNDDGGVDFNSEIQFTPSQDGVYYIGAMAFADETGSYTLAVTGPATGRGSGGDAGDAITITVELSNGETLDIEVPRDRLDEIDAIRISP